VDPLLGNDREMSKYVQPLLSKGFSDNHVHMETIEQEQKNDVFYAVRAEGL
jgi:hypothetical protein